MIGFLTDNAGHKTHAVIPIEEYERITDMLEDIVDAADAERALKELAAGEDELIPAEIAKRLLEENPIRVWREYRRMTLVDLAQAVQISQPYLSQLETGTRKGARATIEQIAEVLQVDPEDLDLPTT